MSYFPCGVKPQKIKIDGVDVNLDKIEYASYDEELSEAQALYYQLICGCAVVLNDEIHVLGGYNTDNKRSHYKLSGTTWTRVSTLPINFNGNMGCVVLNGEIHIISNTDHYKWDGNAWVQLATTPCAATLGVVLDGEIHIMHSSLAKHYKWDGSTWTQVSSMPYTFENGAATVLNGEIHILGGTTNGAISGGTAKHYKWDGNAWTQVSSMPYSASRNTVVVLNNEIHLLGGVAASSSSHVYDLHEIWDGTAWREADNLPYEFAWGAAVVLNGEIHIMGGKSSTSGGSVSTSEHGLKHYILNLKKYRLIIHG